MLAAMLSAAETWWINEEIRNMMLMIERKLIKRILNVKQGTSNELIYMEINEPN